MVHGMHTQQQNASTKGGGGGARTSEGRGELFESQKRNVNKRKAR